MPLNFNGVEIEIAEGVLDHNVLMGKTTLKNEKPAPLEISRL
jgi:hypothetical protein